jgi:hypothetical protein
MANAMRSETDGISVIDETLLSRRRFLKLCVASMAGLSLLVLSGYGGSQDGSGNDNGKKDDEDGGGY